MKSPTGSCLPLLVVTVAVVVLAPLTFLTQTLGFRRGFAGGASSPSFGERGVGAWGWEEGGASAASAERGAGDLDGDGVKGSVHMVMGSSCCWVAKTSTSSSSWDWEAGRSVSPPRKEEVARISSWEEEMSPPHSSATLAIIDSTSGAGAEAEAEAAMVGSWCWVGMAG